MMTAIETAQIPNVILFPIRYTAKEHGKLTARNKYGISVMDRIAKDTGGFGFDAEVVDPETYFHQIGEELRSSYEPAYCPSNPIKDDSFRKIVIRPFGGRGSAKGSIFGGTHFAILWLPFATNWSGRGDV
jgi:Ca-activated chloride channel homolog